MTSPVVRKKTQIRQPLQQQKPAPVENKQPIYEKIIIIVFILILVYAFFIGGLGVVGSTFGAIGGFLLFLLPFYFVYEKLKKIGYKKTTALLFVILLYVFICMLFFGLALWVMS